MDVEPDDPEESEVVFGYHRPQYDSRGNLLGAQVTLDEEHWRLSVVSECTRLSWMRTLGHGSGHCFNFTWVVWINGFAAYPDYHPGDFVRQVCCNIDRSFYGISRKNNEHANETLTVSGMIHVAYVGRTSFLLDSEITIPSWSSKPMFSFSRYSVAIGPDAKPMAVDPIWKSKRLLEIKQRGLELKRPNILVIPNTCLLDSSSMPVSMSDLDINGHAHFKVYILRAFVAVRKAFERRLFTLGHCTDFHWARVESVCCVFDSGAIMGDVIRGDVLRPETGDDYSLYVTFHKQTGARVAYLHVRFYDKLGFRDVPSPKL